MCLQTSPLAGLFWVAARMKSLMRTGHDLPNVVGHMCQYVVDSRCHLQRIAAKQGEHKIPGILRVPPLTLSFYVSFTNSRFLCKPIFYECSGFKVRRVLGSSPEGHWESWGEHP